MSTHMHASHPGRHACAHNHTLVPPGLSQGHGRQASRGPECAAGLQHRGSLPRSPRPQSRQPCLWLGGGPSRHPPPLPETTPQAWACSCRGEQTWHPKVPTPHPSQGDVQNTLAGSVAGAGYRGVHTGRSPCISVHHTRGLQTPLPHSALGESQGSPKVAKGSWLSSTGLPGGRCSSEVAREGPPRAGPRNTPSPSSPWGPGWGAGSGPPWLQPTRHNRPLPHEPHEEVVHVACSGDPISARWGGCTRTPAPALPPPQRGCLTRGSGEGGAGLGRGEGSDSRFWGGARA